MKLFSHLSSCLNIKIIFILVFFVSLGHSQIKNDLDFIATHNPITLTKKNEHFNVSYKLSSERQLFLIGFIRFYQNLIGSQQNNKKVCTFTPGCSDFALEAIQSYGAWYGTLMGADRILRCNNYDRRQIFYQPNFLTRKMNDPVIYYSRFIHKK
jgi:putative membrane protein insertion efficiency factor